MRVILINFMKMGYVGEPCVVIFFSHHNTVCYTNLFNIKLKTSRIYSRRVYMFENCFDVKFSSSVTQNISFEPSS